VPAPNTQPPRVRSLITYLQNGSMQEDANRKTFADPSNSRGSSSDERGCYFSHTLTGGSAPLNVSGKRVGTLGDGTRVRRSERVGKTCRHGP
jgi:hypothetical protein